MRERKKTIFSALIYIVLPKFHFLFSLIILPFISPYITLNDYGIYGILLAYISVFYNLIVLGQNVLLQNSYFTHKNNYTLVWNRCLAIMFIVSIICSLVFSLILYLTQWDKLGANGSFILMLCILYLLMSPIDTIIINYFILKTKPLPYAIGVALVGIISTLVVLFTIRYLRLGYIGWVIALPLNSILTYLFFFKEISLKEKIRPNFFFKRDFFKKSMKIGVPLTPHQLSLYILSVSDRIILEYFKIPLKQIGFYSQGYNIGAQGSIVVNGVFQALSKKLQEAFRNNDTNSVVTIGRLLFQVPILLSVILFIASLWMKEFFFILFRNPELSKAYPIAVIVMCSYMFWSIYAFVTYPPSIEGKTITISKISLLAAVFNIIGNLIFIPHFGIYSALAFTYLSYIVFGFSGLFYKEIRVSMAKYTNIMKLSAILFFLNICLLFIAYSQMDASIVVKITITLSVIVFLFCILSYNHLKNHQNALSDL